MVTTMTVRIMIIKIGKNR